MDQKNSQTGQPLGGDDNVLSKRFEIFAFIAVLLILISPFLYFTRSQHKIKIPVAVSAEFVGSKKCETCHQELYKKWHGSHHDLAMDTAREDTVLGDFVNVEFLDEYTNKTSRFFRKGNGFFVETEGPDGTAATFEITHVFGAFPLQQYLIPFSGGRLQCLNIGWDVNKKTWYRLPPYEVEGHEDWLHWTKASQTWNGMCAECHSTRLKKSYSMESASYDTTWFEIDVGCEACHGPGSNHISWAEKPEMGRKQVADLGLTVTTGTGDNNKQIAICAPCHSRRYQLGDNDHSEGELLDKMVPSLLTEGLYYPDGQILEEVYVYGSFSQSKMYQHNVRCSDCHDMHSLTRHKEGNEICLQCHKAAEYDTEKHHFHKREYKDKPSDGHLCVKCHMPGRVYMGIDYRPDHSIRVPRPDLTESIGVPNSCATSGCHDDKPGEWIVESYTKWYGIARKPHYGETIAAGRKRAPEAEEALIALAENSLQPVIVRATSLSLLANYPGPKTTAVFTSSLEEADALLRATAIRSLTSLDQESMIKLIEPKLYDKVKAVRIEAAAAMARLPQSAIKPEDVAVFKKVLAEYRKAMEYNSDFAAQRYNLGNLEAALNNDDKAIAHYRAAIAIDDMFYPAKVNLAMQLNGRGTNEEAVNLLEDVVGRNPDLYQIAYSLGLLLAEMEKYNESERYLAMAADGLPGNSRVQYNFALVLLKMQKWQEGENALLKTLEIEPASREYFNALANLYLSFRMRDKAKDLAEKFISLYSDHQQAKELLDLVK
jgi:tetratricopeptide (TPR) repeat protein